MGLSKDRKAIKALLRSDIELTFAGLKPFLKRSLWLAKTNRYSVDTINKIRLDKQSLSLRKKKHLAQYIVASSFLHAGDAWGYLGRAINCLISGDVHRAIHFAYYCELRASLSLLAGIGIGIFKNRHFIVTSPHVAMQLHAKGGTHEIAWQALELWSKLNSSGDLFARLIQPAGRPLSDWLHVIGGAPSVAAQAKNWFLQWGMDLRLATQDREARNESSYRPDGIPSLWTVDSHTALEFVRELWSLFEPSSGRMIFQNFDQYILRLVLEKNFFAVTGAAASHGNANFVSFIDRVVNAQSLPPPSADRWKSFFLRLSAATDPELFQYSRQVPSGSSEDFYSVISRAVLLLRMATGSAEELTRNAGIQIGALEFWWSSVARARGFVADGSSLARPSDLWADVEDALGEVDGFAHANPAVLGSVGGLHSAIERKLFVLCSQERAGLWSLCPA